MKVLLTIVITLLVVVEGGQEVKEEDLMMGYNNIFENSNSTSNIFRHEPPNYSMNCGVDSDQLTTNAAVVVGGQSDAEKMTKGRSRRSASLMQLDSRRLYIDFMVTVDSTMTAFHGHGEKLKSYIRSVLGVTAQLFRDPSLGQSIDIALVDVIEHDIRVPERPVNGGVNAHDLLQAFCNFTMRNTGGHDTSIYLTRKHLCDSTSNDCGTMGLANVGTICIPKSSCGIVRDYGIRTGFILAHEVGHLLGMKHDNSVKCAEVMNVQLNNDSDSDHRNIMNSHTGGGAHPHRWTKCSRHYLDLLLADNLGSCLEHRPQGQLILGDDDDTSTFDLSRHVMKPDYQCQLVFGGDRDQGRQGPHRQCGGKPTCEKIHCTVGSECYRGDDPWADGTPCGQDQWCIRGQCVFKKVLKMINGEWGPWTTVGSCSRPCGGGFRRVSRQCDNPVPQHGGRFCVGERLRFETCNLVPCIGTKKPSRADQCSSFNGKKVEDLPDADAVKEIWRPYLTNFPSTIEPATKRRVQCQLQCVGERINRYYTLDNKVVDGTRCTEDPHDFSVCVNGLCHPAGCDGKLNSVTKLDSCEVCGGRDTCLNKMVKGSYNEDSVPRYRTVVTIPKGAKLIKIRQSSKTARQVGGGYDNNYLVLAVPSVSKDDPLRNVTIELNQMDSSIQYHPKKRIRLAGTYIDYSGCNDAIETLNSSRGSPPTTTELILMVYSHPGMTMSRPNIFYEFYVSSTVFYIPINDDLGWTCSILIIIFHQFFVGSTF